MRDIQKHMQLVTLCERRDLTVTLDNLESLILHPNTSEAERRNAFEKFKKLHAQHLLNQETSEPQETGFAIYSIAGGPRLTQDRLHERLKQYFSNISQEALSSFISDLSNLAKGMQAQKVQVGNLGFNKKTETQHLRIIVETSLEPDKIEGNLFRNTGFTPAPATMFGGSIDPKKTKTGYRFGFTYTL